MRRKVVSLSLLGLALLLLATLGGTLSPTLAQAGLRMFFPYVAKNAVIAPPTLPPAPPPTSVPETPSPEPPAPRTIDVIARAYAFEPSTIEVRVGEAVRFVVTSPDMFHTFTVKRNAAAQEMLINLSVFPSAPAETTFTFTEPGDYYLYCIPHEVLGMTGIIRVLE